MFRKLLSLDEARQIVQKYAPTEPLGVEEVALLDASGRILAEDVVSNLDIPPFRRSTVDGYAVVAENTFGAEENKPVSLKVCGSVNVGEPPDISIRSWTAAEIVTGAPIPDGADAVVMIEHTEREGDKVLVYSAVAHGENLMNAGSDIGKGEEVLKKGQLLGSREIGVLAAIGCSSARVFVLPQIAVLSTGAEIQEPGKRLREGRVYDINAYSLSIAIKECGARPLYCGVFPDDVGAIQEALAKALTSADLVVTSGGVSVGPKDFIPKILNSLGKPGIIVSGVAIKPGKPLTVASLGGKLVFSLPGHPTSALLVFHLLARPVIVKLTGRNTKEAAEVKAVAGMRMFPAKGRHTFVMVKLVRDEPSKLLAEPVAYGLSGAITTLAKADGFVEIAENQQFVDAGEEVRVKLFGSHGDWEGC